MYYKKKKDPKKYYTCTLLATNKTYISVSKKFAVDLVKLHPDTLKRHLIHSDIYKTDDFIINKNVVVNNIYRGFAM